MDKSAIRNFAVSARVKLMEAITQKAYELGITKSEIKKVNVYQDFFEIEGRQFPKFMLKHRESLVKRINEKGIDQVIEEATYTWFNRFIAIRFMEVNGYLPTGVRVLSSEDPNRVEPDAIREIQNIDLDLNMDLVYRLQDEHKTDELFKYILIKQCNELGKIMPPVFEEIEDYTELLLPDNLLQEGSVIRDLVTMISEDDWREQVEIIGWLYQYYISEKKDKVFADLKKNIKITKENIPAATQLFTPDWIVKYMVENSLGRLWLESHPNKDLQSEWKYYLEEAEQEPEVKKQLEEIRNKNLNPEEIKVLDPAMGSGHILVYAFDVLYDIYKAAGYPEKDIPRLILEKNLYGLDIDDRAAQLAYFAVMMKARSRSRRIFREKLNLNLCSIQESNGFPKEAIDFLVNSKETELEKRVHRDDIEYLLEVFKDAKEYGSILEVKHVDFDAIEARLEDIRNGDIQDLFEVQYRNVILEVIPGLLNQARVMSGKYDVVCTNPPYMGRKGMNLKLIKYIDNKFKDTKSDIFAVFMESGLNFIKNNRYMTMINQHSWMFLTSFEKLREKLICKNDIYNMLHLGAKAFEEIGGEVVQSTAFVLRNRKLNGYIGTYIRLVEEINAIEKQNKMIQIINEDDSSCKFTTKTERFLAIPGYPIAYWADAKTEHIFNSNNKLGDIAEPRQGMATADNEKFLRYWYEVNINRIGFEQTPESYKRTRFKWFPYNKGGTFRKWYGNNDYIVNWENDGQEIKNYEGSVIRNPSYYFKEGMTWSSISSGAIALRYTPTGFLFDSKGPMCFPKNEINLKYLLGFLNTSVATKFLKILAPTLDFNQGPLSKIPIIIDETKKDTNDLVDQNIRLSIQDWDSFENSWGFKRHPLIMNKANVPTVEDAFKEWKKFTESQFNQLKQNEEELNRIFIEIYGLQGELTPQIDDKDITIRKADQIRDIKSFISYAVGCMFGRYSLDEEGLIYAGGEFNPDKYKIFKADIDNVIPITDDEYFEDDIVSRFVDFVRVTFSQETLEESLDYIAETLGRKTSESSRQAIRRYFLKDFYKDHLQNYQKRPIYWVFDSGKNDGFKALIYMHRYDVGTVAKVRTDYLHLLQRKYESEMNRLDITIDSPNASTKEKSDAKKRKEKIQKQLHECMQYDQIISHVANLKISIDLDDGVSVNYTKFQEVEVPQGEGRKPLKADLLGKI